MRALRVLRCVAVAVCLGELQLQCVRVCVRALRVLQCAVATWQYILMCCSCSVLQLQCGSVCGHIYACMRAVCCSVLHCVAVCCSVVQCGAVCCRWSINCIRFRSPEYTSWSHSFNRRLRLLLNTREHSHYWDLPQSAVLPTGVVQRVAACCSVLQRVAACCSVLQYAAATIGTCPMKWCCCFDSFLSVFIFCVRTCANIHSKHKENMFSCPSLPLFFSLSPPSLPLSRSLALFENSSSRPPRGWQKKQKVSKYPKHSRK